MVVNYFCKTHNLRCLIGFWIPLWCSYLFRGRNVFLGPYQIITGISKYSKDWDTHPPATKLPLSYPPYLPFRQTSVMKQRNFHIGRFRNKLHLGSFRKFCIRYALSVFFVCFRFSAFSFVSNFGFSFFVLHTIVSFCLLRSRKRGKKKFSFFSFQFFHKL